MASKHIGLGIMFAERSMRTLQDPRIDREDILGVAMLAIAKAAAKFNPQAGWKFSSYATRVFQNDLSSFLNSEYGRGAQLPVRTRQQVVAFRNFRVENGHYPSMSEAEQMLGLKMRMRRERYIEIRNACELTEPQMEFSSMTDSGEELLSGDLRRAEFNGEPDYDFLDSEPTSI